MLFREIRTAVKVAKNPPDNRVRAVLKADFPQYLASVPCMHGVGIRIEVVRLETVTEAAVRVLIRCKRRQNVPAVPVLKMITPARKLQRTRVAVNKNARFCINLVKFIHRHPPFRKTTFPRFVSRHLSFLRWKRPLSQPFSRR